MGKKNKTKERMHDLIYIKTKSNIYAQVHEHMQEKIWEDKYQTITRITSGERNGICGRGSRKELRYGG